MNFKKKTNQINELINSARKTISKKKKLTKQSLWAKTKRAHEGWHLHFEAMPHYDENLDYTAHVFNYNYNLLKEKAAKNRNLPSLAYSQV